MTEPGEISETVPKSMHGSGGGTVCSDALGESPGLVSYFAEHPDSDRECNDSDPLVEYVSGDDVLVDDSAPQEVPAAKDLVEEVIEVVFYVCFMQSIHRSPGTSISRLLIAREVLFEVC